MPVHKHLRCHLTTSRSLRVAIIKAILTVSLSTMLAYIIVASASVMWPPVTSLAFHLKSSILISNIIWHSTNWWPMGNDFPSGKTSNSTLTFSISLDIASVPKVLQFLASRAIACFTVLGSSMPNLWLLFRYLVCCFLTLAIILSFFFQHMLNPLVKSRLMINPLCNSKLSCLHWMRFL